VSVRVRLYPSLSVTSRSSVNTAERIELVSAWELSSTYPTLCYKRIRVCPNISTLSSGTLSRTLDLENFDGGETPLIALSFTNWTVLGRIESTIAYMRRRSMASLLSSSVYSTTSSRGSINVRSLLCKYDDVIELCRDRPIDLLCLTETWHDVDSAVLGRLRLHRCRQTASTRH